jgi:hypothetical protein
VRWPSSSSPSSGGRRGAVPGGQEAPSRPAAEAPDVRMRSDGRGCVCVRVCVRVAWGRPIRGGLEGRRGEALSARDSARIAPSYVDVGAWRGRGPRAMGPIAEAESGPSRRRDSGSPLISLCLRWDGVPRASPSAAVRMCCALVRSALTVVRSKRCVAGFRCRASCAADVAPRSGVAIELMRARSDRLLRCSLCAQSVRVRGRVEAFVRLYV